MDRLASVKFAVTVVVIIAVACVAGTLIPQGADVAKYIRHDPDAAGHMELLGKLGLTHVFFRSGLSACSARSRRPWRYAARGGLARSAHERLRPIPRFGSMLTHISILLIFNGRSNPGVWGEKGYIELREGETNAQVVTKNSTKPLPFAIHLTKFEIETSDRSGAGVGRGRRRQEITTAGAETWFRRRRRPQGHIPGQGTVEQAFSGISE